MTKHCKKELGEDYEKICEIDVGSTKTSVLLTVASLVVIVAIVLPLLLTVYDGFFNHTTFVERIISLGVMLFVLIAYIILHELLHGIVYKAATKEKLVFGLTLTFAYCGVPNIYVARKYSLVACAAPLVVFGVIFVLTTVLFTVYLSIWYGFLAMILTAFHFGGCVGDIYVILLLLFVHRNTEYVKDNGTKQEFFAKRTTEQD